MKMGIGIGWPNAASGSGNKQGWFNVPESCSNGSIVGGYTQYFESTDYKEGDYVYAIGGGGYVLLGAFQTSDPVSTKIFTIEGPVTNSCPI